MSRAIVGWLAFAFAILTLVLVVWVFGVTDDVHHAATAAGFALFFFDAAALAAAVRVLMAGWPALLRVLVFSFLLAVAFFTTSFGLFIGFYKGC